MSTAPPRDILVCALLPIGDTLFTTPALAAIRRRYPHARITALTYQTNRGVLQANPDVDRFWPAPTRDFLRTPARLLNLIRAVRTAGFERVFQFSNYNYGLDYWSGIRERTSVPLPFLWLLRPGAGRQWRRRHAVEHYADVVQRAGIAIEDWRLRMYITLEEIAARDHLLQANGVRPNEPVVGIHPGGEGLYGRKQWSREGFAAVADGLHQRFGVKILVLGGKDDARAAAEVAALSSAPVLNLAGQTTLGATAAMAARCALFVGNDSSPLHLAVAAGTRVVGIYGITDPQSFHPWLPGGQPGRDFAIVRSPAPCGCCFPQLGGASLPEVIRCLRCHPFDSITPELVLDAAVPLLAAQMG